MDTNVLIQHFRRGALLEERDVHNTWTNYGHAYLAQMIAENPPDTAPTPQRDDRIRYMGLGIGGVYQAFAATQSPLVDAYPPGSAAIRWPPSYSYERGSYGNEYNQQDPLSPQITTLELPARVTGTDLPYPGDPGDKWLIEPPELYVSHLSLQELTVHATVDCSLGEYVHGGLTVVPITEAGLFTSVCDPVGSAYQPLVAYVNFDTLLLDANSLVKFTWRVRFA